MRPAVLLVAVSVALGVAGCTPPKRDATYYLHHDAERKTELSKCGNNTADAECVAAMQAQDTKDQTNPKALHALDKKL